MTARRFTAVIVDDEPLAIEGLKSQCQEWGAADVIGEAADGATALALIRELKPDAVFLDISMPGLSGLDVARDLAKLENRPLITFVTAHDHYATEAFDLSVVDYILKPIESARFGRAMERLLVALETAGVAETRPSEFWVPFRGGLVRVQAEDIRRVEAERDYVRLFTADGSYLVRATLTDMLSRLDAAGFLRIHRSVIVAKRRIAGFRHVGAGSWVVVDGDGAEAPIGRSYLAQVREEVGL